MYVGASGLGASGPSVTVGGWDAAFVARGLPVVRLLRDRYFRSSTLGAENIPAGPAMFVGMHGGGLMAADAMLMGLAFYEATRLRRPLYFLAHASLFRVPGLAKVITRAGAVVASPAAARAIVDAGQAFAVFPGGEHDSVRTFRRRDEVELAGRTGFVRTALECDVPVVPMASLGGGSTWIVLDDGRWLARALGLKQRLRLETLAIALALPWGLTLGLTPYLPAPVRIDVAFGAPMRFHPSAAERHDPGYHAHVRDEVQKAMERLIIDMRIARSSSPRAARQARDYPGPQRR